ncbi:MAG: hypothetical protein ACHQUA_00030 [Microgenomates group bacterium]
MPVTKTAKRALRSSKKKESVNKLIISKLEAAIRVAKAGKVEKVLAAMSLADKASKKKVLHKNKVARIKASLSKFLPKGKVSSKPKATKKK